METIDLNQSGTIFDIQRYSLQDGPGIRTTVFLKGCHFRCLWCHNPESFTNQPQISYQPARCIGCGYCVRTCPNGCHTMVDGVHIYNREACVSCGQCTAECFAKSLELIGKKMKADEVMKEVLKDKLFYENSGGGMTISGGEPMCQPKFTYALLKLAKQNGIHTCLETNGDKSTTDIADMTDLIDLFLFDYKETNPELHKKYTGETNEQILKNLMKLNELSKAVILRCPIVPGLNDRDEHFAGIAEAANKCDNILEINIEPYHPLGLSKCDRLGLEAGFDKNSFADDAEIEGWIKTIQSQTKTEVKRIG